MSTRYLAIQLELELATCQHSFGQAPCTASGQPCYNYFYQCLDKDNFAQTLTTLKFCSAKQAALPVNEGCLPLLSGNIVPTGSKVQPGATLGLRGSVTIPLVDMPHNDIGLDPYREQRDSPAAGKVFARLFARYKFLLNRPIRLVFIWRNEAGEESRETRHYLIDRIEKTASGWTLTGVDPLKRLMDKQLTLPHARLAVAIPEARGDDILISLDSTGNPNNPEEQNLFNRAGGYIRIGDEIFSYTGISGNSLTGVAETTHGSSERRAYKVGDAVVDCAYWEEQNPMDILVDLFNRAGAGGYLDMPYVRAQRDKHLSSYKFSAIIPDNTSVLNLMNEIVQQTVISAVFDERRQKIMMRVVAPPRRAPSVFFATGPEGNARNVSFSDTLKNYASTVRIYYAMRKVTAGNESTNFNELAIVSDGDFAGELGFDHSRDLVQHSRWYPAYQTTQVQKVANLILKRRRAGVRRVKFFTSLELTENIELATHIVLIDADACDSYGNPEAHLLFVDEITPVSVAEARVEGTIAPYPATQRYLRLSPNGIRVKYKDATPEQRLKWGFLGRNGGGNKMSDGTPGYGLAGR